MASLTGRIILAAARRNATYTPVRFCKSKSSFSLILTFFFTFSLIRCITLWMLEIRLKIDNCVIRRLFVCLRCVIVSRLSLSSQAIQRSFMSKLESRPKITFSPPRTFCWIFFCLLIFPFLYLLLILVMSDPMDHATGIEKRELLARAAGNDDPFDMKVFKRGPGTKETPNLIPSAFDARLVGCICK